MERLTKDQIRAEIAQYRQLFRVRRLLKKEDRKLAAILTTYRTGQITQREAAQLIRDLHYSAISRVS